MYPFKHMYKNVYRNFTGNSQKPGNNPNVYQQMNAWIVVIFMYNGIYSTIKIWIIDTCKYMDKSQHNYAE